MDLSMNTVYSEYAEKLHSIEEELHAQPITEEVREHIVHELDVVHDGLSQLEITASRVNRFAISFLEELRQKTILLYGEVVEFFHQHEIDVIQNETKSLQQTLQQKDFLRISQLVDSLKMHIQKLLESYSPGLQERRVLVFAGLALEQAEGLLQGTLTAKTMLTEESCLEIEEILEEINEYLGNSDKVSLRLLWARLTPHQRKLVMSYLNPGRLTVSLLHDIERPTYEENLLGV